MLKIYTDGSCPPQTGIGGWAFVVTENNQVQHTNTGHELTSTNNKMELTAIISALKYLKEIGHKDEVILYSDSQYCVRGITQWVRKWKLNGWKSTTGDVKNKELWEELDGLVNELKVDFVWVRGHDVCQFNNMADKLAVAAGNLLKK